MGIYTSVSTGIYSRNIWIPSNILNTFRQTGVRSSLPYPRVSRNSFKDLGRGPFLEISRKIWGGVVRASRNSDFRKISRFDPEIAWNLGLWIVWSVRLLTYLASPPLSPRPRRLDNPRQPSIAPRQLDSVDSSYDCHRSYQ